MRVRFAQFLASRGYVSPQQADALVWRATNVREAIGAIALSHELIDLHQLDQILAHLWGERRFGEVAVELGYLTPAQVEALLAIQELQEAVEVGEALVIRALMTRAQLAAELHEFIRQVDGQRADSGDLVPAAAGEQGAADGARGPRLKYVPPEGKGEHG
jgi:hypothetical protein